MSQEIINSNNIDALKKYPDNYFDSIVTDPPYGLGKEPDAVELMKDWVEKGYHEISGSGFMGKEWDAFVPQPLFWKEVFRVLKPGGHVLAFYGTRTYDWGVMAMRFAGFEVRDCIQWLYGSGFPKSHNVSKAIDKMYGAEREIIGVSENWRESKRDRAKDGKMEVRGKNAGLITCATSEEAKLWDGWGSALKPANEPIVLARKPLEKGLSIAENVLEYGTGGINIDGSRVGTEGATQRSHQSEYPKKEDGTEDRSGHWARVGHNIQELNKGRFPANIILTHHPECEEIIEDWNCHPDCPIKILDEQSENVSRFFYVAKASKSERNRGLDEFENKKRADINKMMGESGNFKTGSGNDRTTEFKNFHPTVKPVKLMQYLVRLVTPPNGKVLDPFCGSGTTGIACKIEGFKFVGIEQDPQYCKIAEARISIWGNDENNKTELKQINLF